MDWSLDNDLYTTTANVNFRRYFTCEKCQCRFFFRAVGSGMGSASKTLLKDSAETVSEARDKALRRANVRAFRIAVACPQCGWYQASMVRAWRHARLRWIVHLGWFALATVPLLFMPARVLAFNEFEKAALIAFDGLVLIAFLCRWIIVQRFDPNAAYPTFPPKRAKEPPAFLAEQEDNEESLCEDATRSDTLPA